MLARVLQGCCHSIRIGTTAMGMESAPLKLLKEVGCQGSAQPASAGMAERNAIMLFPPGAALPAGWQTPWVKAGWVVSSGANSGRIPESLRASGASALIAPLRDKNDKPRSSKAATGGLGGVIRALDAANDGRPSPSAMVGGSLRRSDFLTQLSAVAEAEASALSVLMAIHVDQASTFAGALDRTAIFDLEESISARITRVLESRDATTIWLEFGFGVLVQRETADQVRDLARQICASVASEPFKVGEKSMDLTVSIGLALSPTESAADRSQEWFSTAHAAQGIASRHGGNRHEGVLTREFEPMPAERVLIIREWIDEAKAGKNVIVEFQPLLPASAGAGELYSVHAKLRDFRAPLGGVYRQEYLRLARDAGAMVMIDRIALFHAFETLEQEHRARRGTRLLVPVEMESLSGMAWRWLVETLRRTQHLRDRLILEIQATPALREKENLLRIIRLRRFGVRVCLRVAGKDLNHIPAWSKLPADLVRVSYAAVQSCTDAEFSALVRSWRSRGRKLMVAGVSEPGAVGRLSALAVDYLRGQALAATGPRLDYDFSATI
jgi:multidomain signaling protein FimX